MERSKIWQERDDRSKIQTKEQPHPRQTDTFFMFGGEQIGNVIEGGVFMLPWKQQGSCHGALSQSLWRQTQAPSGQGSHTCSRRSAF